MTTKVVDSTAPRKAQAEDPWDLVRRLAGVEVHEQGQGPGFAANAVLRGFSSDHSSDLLLVVDGVPINLPLHGDFAFGGVIDVTTPWGGTGPAGDMGGSSFGDWPRLVSNRCGAGRRGLAGRRAVRAEPGLARSLAYWLGNGILRWRGGAGKGRLEAGLLGYRTGWDSPGFLSVAHYNARRLTQSGDPTDGGSAGRVAGHARYNRVLSARPGCRR